MPDYLLNVYLHQFLLQLSDAMKRQGLFLICIMNIICIFAEAASPEMEYRPFAVDGKVWEAQVGIIMENTYGYRIDGDTVIGGERWLKVHSYMFPDLRGSYYAAVRDDGQKVYAIAKNGQRARLLYDFGLNEGDVVRCGAEGNLLGCLLDSGEEPDSLLGFPYMAYLKVERVDTVVARGREHRRLTLSLLDPFREWTMAENVVWVTGIGSGAGPFSPWMPLPPQDTFLLHCEINRTCILGFEDFYKSDATDVVSDTQQKNKEPLNSFDLSGRRISVTSASSVPSVLPKGVYIRDGKKVMVK